MAEDVAEPLAGLLARQLTMPSRVDEITDRLVTAIAIGEYLPGARLPVERELAAALGVGRMTVRAASARANTSVKSRACVRIRSAGSPAARRGGATPIARAGAAATRSD